MSGTNTPSGRIIAAAEATKEVADVRGRKIRYRRLGALDRMRLLKAVGPTQSSNAPYLGMAMIAASVTQVDEVPMPWPTTDAQIEAAVARLDDDGLNAVAGGLVADAEAASESADDAGQQLPA